VSDPQHYRTLWYARFRNGRDRLVLLDALHEQVDALPEIPDTPGLLPASLMDGGPGGAALPAVITLQDPDTGETDVVDGRHIIEVLRIRGETNLGPDKLQVIQGLSAAELNEIRQRNPGQ
jgi:hypothetical protein